ncbi:response regulator [Bacteroides sp. 519]|uniref:response regulator n=1 Tax=Bacteroides sp. 519 TaxID=2302937 RepID=UPI0013D7F9DB|nr:response regulator [Bacteroides sp. 519]NDV60458.1 response regulator [Bacteroides sp. 519]
MKTGRYFSFCFTAIFILLLFNNKPLYAKHYLYKQISLKAGLPSTLRCIFADTKGFIWTGTKGGLGRFDGNEQKKYIHQRGNPNSLPGNVIYQIQEDPYHNLWVMTDKGIARYNYRTNDFTPLIDENGENFIAYSAYWWKDRLLFGGKNTVYVYDNDKNTLNVLFKLENQHNFDIIKLMLATPDTLLCCSRWEGICTINLQTGVSAMAPFGCGKEITDLFVDSKQRIWIAPYNQGLHCFTADGKEIASYTTRNSRLSNDIVLSMTERKEQIWIGTDGGGINILNPENGEFTHLKHIPGDKQYSLPTNSINCLYIDDYNNMWIGGIFNGLINMREVSMKTYTDALSSSNLGLSNNIVLSLYQDDSELIWIGTDGGGINSFNPYTEVFKYYPSTSEDKVTSICPFAPGKLLFSAFSDGIYIFDTALGTKTPFTVIDEATTTNLCKHGNSVYLYRNAPDQVLLLGDHVYVYNLKQQTFTIATEQPEGLIYWGTLQAIDSKEDCTYLFDFKRLYKLDHQTLCLTPLFVCNDEMCIYAVAYEKEGNFWIGTNQGLNRYTPGMENLEPVPTNLFTEISSVVCDPQGKIWIGAENRLFSYLPQENKFILYGESDGATPNEYVPRSQLVSKQKDTYMGGVKGLLHIGSNRIAGMVKMPDLQLSDIILNGESVNSKPNKKQDVLSVPWNSNLTLQIMTKEEDIFRQKLYRYRIEGLDNTYTESYNPEVVFRAPRPGSYKIMVSCTAKDGNWIPDRQLLELTVRPPWYQSWWFLLGCFLVVLETFRNLLKRKEHKLKWAMKEHEQQVYEEKVRFLINISHELRTPLTLIYAPLKRILKSLPPNDSQYLPLKAIYRQSQRMKALINMVLDVRKMEVGESKLYIEPHLLNEWIEHISQDFVKEGEAEHVHIRYQLDSQIKSVSFDKDKCEIILSNLLINALKHSPQNSYITIVSETLPGGNRVRISVSDQGCGIEQADMQKLFTRFYQGTGEKNGTGIGLSYSKILAEQHAGCLGVRNNLGAGATFFFELPLKQDAEEIICRPKAYLNELIADESCEIIPGEESLDTTSNTILIADDDPDMTDFLKKSLEEHFKHIVVAANGAEAFRLTQSHVPDIIISDIMMPRMNGYQLCKQIKEDITVSHIPIILLTARDDDQSQKDGYKNGADAYLTKPFEVDILLELIRNRLKNREVTRKRYMNAGPVPVPEETTFSQADETFLLKLNKIIQDNIANCSLDIAFICKEIGMSRASLYNKLKALTDMSANEYINKFRMEKAIQYINNTDMVFTEIAEKVGFATSSYFSTAFKQYMGETPTQYRKKKN